MENLDRLMERILREAEEQAAEILKDADAEADRIAADAKKKSQEIETRALDAARAHAAEDERRAEITRSLDERNAVLRAKGDVIDGLLAEVPRTIHELPDELYLALIKKMMYDAAPEGDVEVVVASSDSGRITPNVIKQVSTELENAGRRASLRLSKDTASVSGGFLLKTASVEVDCTLDSLLASFQDELAPLVAEALFGR